ncbi:unnamed protein product [Arabidopsis lyrata]|uniref:Uncharacterized protein n=2 Tax=Arabidopsis lyrata subsp. lyrata TaxID=81972 RepID=D7KFX5_ARALL|nr:hypothetical protein ARALYDRAFT_891955 [Arabidopsis lyrata subsp. lyrata]CAH8255159.1 unnamed protein product [Arabidopsis lyrata]
MNASQAQKLHLLKKATGKDSEFVKYTGLKKACRDFAETYTSFFIWLALGSFTLISAGWELHSRSQMEKGLASLRVEMNNNAVVISEFKKEMSSKDASYMHRFEEITRIANQKLEDLEKKIELLTSKK